MQCHCPTLWGEEGINVGATPKVQPKNWTLDPEALRLVIAQASAPWTNQIKTNQSMDSYFWGWEVAACRDAHLLPHGMQQQGGGHGRTQLCNKVPTGATREATGGGHRRRQLPRGGGGGGGDPSVLDANYPPN